MPNSFASASGVTLSILSVKKNVLKSASVLKENQEHQAQQRKPRGQYRNKALREQPTVACLEVYSHQETRRRIKAPVVSLELQEKIEKKTQEEKG